MRRDKRGVSTVYSLLLVILQPYWTGCIREFLSSGDSGFALGVEMLIENTGFWAMGEYIFSRGILSLGAIMVTPIWQHWPCRRGRLNHQNHIIEIWRQHVRVSDFGNEIRGGRRGGKGRGEGGEGRKREGGKEGGEMGDARLWLIGNI